MFRECIKKIREAIYGADVREAIASALEKAYTDSSTNADMEVIAARGEFENLGLRLDSIEENIVDESTELRSIEEQMAELESKITGFENSKLQVVTLPAEEYSKINIGSGMELPIFDLVEDADSLLAVIYYISYVSNGYGGYNSFPAFIRSGEGTGYYASSCELGFVNSTHGNVCDGAQLNFERAIDLSEAMHIVNRNSSYEISISEIKAFVITRW